jgi:hypothetical protein
VPQAATDFGGLDRRATDEGDWLAAIFIIFWGEGHSPSSPANIRYVWQQIFEWYAKYLGTGPQTTAASGGSNQSPVRLQKTEAANDEHDRC